jgi:exopolysaccharide biosynthesis WecB/TagA/CpsF family protein
VARIVTDSAEQSNETGPGPGVDGLDWGSDPAQPVLVSVPDRGALLADLERRLLEQRGFSVATLNLDHIVKLKHDPAFRAAYAAQTHVTADGNPVVWLSHLAGQRDIRLVTGADTVMPVVALAARLGVPLGLFGSVETSLEAAARRLCADHPGLEVPFRQAPAMGFDPDGPAADAAIDAIAASGARVVLLALGAPKQERFAARAQRRLPQVGFLSIGAGIDFISGFQKRAPAWVRAARAEWLWRVASNPGRLAGRYGNCLLALPGLILKALAWRRRNRMPRA